jgi:hypothetical protein
MRVRVGLGQIPKANLVQLKVGRRQEFLLLRADKWARMLTILTRFGKRGGIKCHILGTVLMSFFTYRNHAAVGHVTLDMLELDRGVVDAKAGEQTLLYFAQNTLAG